MMDEERKMTYQDDDLTLTDENVTFHNPAKFIWSEDDVEGLVWLDDHEYTGTVPPG